MNSAIGCVEWPMVIATGRAGFSCAAVIAVVASPCFLKFKLVKFKAIKIQSSSNLKICPGQILLGGNGDRLGGQLVHSAQGREEPAPERDNQQRSHPAH